MQTANIMLALGGNRDQVIPKFNVTPAEVAVLRFIHGDDAVTDIEPNGEINRRNRDERQRLVETYGRRLDGNRHVAPAVDALFPGAAARVFEKFEETDLPDDFYKAATRVGPARVEQEDVPEVEVFEPAAEGAGSSEGAAQGADEGAGSNEGAGGDEGDGIGDIDDGMGGDAGQTGDNTAGTGGENLFA